MLSVQIVVTTFLVIVSQFNQIAMAPAIILALIWPQSGPRSAAVIRSTEML